MLNQAQIAGQQLQRQFKQNKLDELNFTQGQYDDEKDRLNASPHSGPDYSGYSNERDYLNGLNRQGSIAGLRSELAGKGPLQVSHTYGGTNFAARPSLSALSSMAGRTPVDPNDESDNANYFLKQNAIRGGQLQVNAMEDAQNDRALSDNAYRVGQRGNIAREELARNARAAGQAGASEANEKYFGTEGIRNDQRFEQRSVEADQGYADPAVEIARIKGNADVQKAGMDKNREQAAALKAYTDLIKNQATLTPTVRNKVPGSGVLGTDWLAREEETPNPAFAAHQQAIDDARKVIGVGGNDPQQGGRELSSDQLQAFASENGMTLDEVTKLAQQYGYAIR